MEPKESKTYRQQTWSLQLALGFLVLAWLILALPWLSGRVTIPWDAKAHFLPQVQFLSASLSSGQAPFWTPYVFSGHPQIADPQSLIFSPPFLLLSWLDPAPGNRSFDATIFGMVLLGQIGTLMYGLARGWRPAAALMSAIAFGFGGAMAWRVQHVSQVLSLVWFCVALWLLEVALQRPTWWRGLLAGCAIGLLASGRDQVALLCIFVLVARVVSFWIDQRRSALKMLVPAALVSSAIAVLPVLLTFLLAETSNRPAIDLLEAGKGSLHPALLLTSLVPDLFGAAGSMESYWGPPSFPWQGTGLYLAQNMGVIYIGAVPLVLVLLGVARGHIWRRDFCFVSVATILMLIYALGWYTPIFSFLHSYLPGVGLFRRPADAVFPLGALAVLMAGQSLNDWLRTRDERGVNFALISVIAVIASMIIAAVWLATLFERLESTVFVIGTSLVAVLLALALLIAVKRKLNDVGVGLLLLFLVCDLFWHNRPNGATGLQQSEYEMLDLKTPNETLALLKKKILARAADGERDRVELLGLGFAWPNASLTHQLDNILGYNPLRLGIYSEAVGAEDHVASPEQRRFSPLFPSYRSLLADLLGLRFVVSSVPLEQIDKAAIGGLELVSMVQNNFIYENKSALPRVLFVTDSMAADFDEILRSGIWPNFDPKVHVLLEVADGGALVPRRAGNAELVSYRNNEVVVEVVSPEGGWIVLNDPWHAWWRAEVDGQDAPLLRANVLFRAVQTSPGWHSVRIYFAPIAGAFSEIVARASIYSK